MAKVYMGTTEMTPAVLKVVGTAEGVVLPDQVGNAGKFLTTDGENVSWANVDAVTQKQFTDHTVATNAHSNIRGVAGGLATLDSNAKVPMSQINDSLLGNVSYQGLWNATENIPFLADPSGDLPLGYTQLQAIKGSGGAYIDTGVVFTGQKIKYVMDWSGGYGTYEKLYGACTILENYASSDSTGCIFFAGNRDNVCVNIGKSNFSTGIKQSGKMSTELIVDSQAKYYEFIINDNRYTGAFTGDVNREIPIHLCRQNYQTANTTVPKPFAGNVYSFSLEMDGVIVRNMLPARRDSDGVVGMYDTINDVFYGPADVGVFIAVEGDIQLPKGDYYITSVAGDRFGLHFDVGDWVISTGEGWTKVDNTDAVVAVNGRTGNVTLGANDVGAYTKEEVNDLIDDITLPDNILVNNATDANSVYIGNTLPQDAEDSGQNVLIGSGSKIVGLGTNNNTVVGTGAASYGSNSVVIGKDATALENAFMGSGAIAIGKNAKAVGSDSIVIGTNALSNSSQGANVVIGPDSKISGYSFNSTAVGIGAQAQNYDATAIGRNVSAGAQYSFAAGYAAQTNPVYCDDSIDSAQPVVAVGFGAVSRSNGTIAIGQDVYADGPYSIAIGQNSTVAEGNKYGIAIGSNARGVSESVAIGYITSGSMNSVTIGSRANCGSSTGVSIGYASQANSDGLESIAIGGYAATNKSHAIALGYNAKASSENTLAIGKKAEAKMSSSVAIGTEAKVGGDEGIAVGHSSVSARHGIALGTRANANDFGTVSIGLNSESTSTNAVAIGNQSYARGQDSVALGSSAVVEEGAGFAVQLGVGTNYDANTLQFKDYKLLYENGVIPYNRFTDINSPSNGQTLVYDENEDMLVWSDAAGGISEVNWGDITGSINNQTDLNNKFISIDNNIQSLDIDMSTNYQNLNNKVDDAIQNLEQDFSTSTRRLESDIQDAEDRLQSQIDTLSSIGQFLAIWDCDTGIARYLNEGFEYQTGNYFIIGTIAEGEGAVNYMPDGNMYPGKVATTEEDVKVSDMWFYDGEHWIYLANHERAIAVDAELNVNSTNPIENQAVTKVVGDLDVKIDDKVDTINVAIEELKNRPIPIAVPQLASVDVDQVKTPGEKAARLPKEEWMGDYSDIVVTLNLTKEQILERMYDLYVTVSRFKTNKNLTYTEYSENGEQDIRYRNISKFSVMNDLRQKTDERLYCWRFISDSGYNETDPRRYCYFYTKDNYNDNVDALWEEDPNIGLWSGYGNSAGIGTCFNAIVWNEHGYRVQMFYDDYFESGGIERYEEGDIDSFANVSNSSHYPEYNISNYVTKMECRKYTKDGQNYFFWAEKDEWENGGCGSCVGSYLAPVPNGIPKYMEELVNAFDEVRQLEENGFVFVEKRPDLNYKRVEDFEALLEALQDLTFRGKFVDNDGYPTYWNCYWFDYPVMPVLLKDCEVRLHTGSARWVKLEDVVKEDATDELRDDLPLELKLPYNTYYLWMRFCSLQKRCAYGNYSNWMQEEGREIDRPMWPYQKHDLKHGVSDYNVLGRRAFARPRQSYKGSDSSKVSEYILFNVCSPLDAASGLKSKSTPIQKKLNIDHHAKTGLRD